MVSSLKSLYEIKRKAHSIEPYLDGSDENAKANYEDLVDRFYQENEEMMAPQQYEAAKKDVEYFLRLLALAMAYYREEG